MLRNEAILSKESAYFLRMTLDSRLNWEEHINKLRAKEKRALNTIKVEQERNRKDPKVPKSGLPKRHSNEGTQTKEKF